MFLEIFGNFTNVISRLGKFLKIDNVLKYLGQLDSIYGHYKTKTNFIWLGTIILSVIAVKIKKINSKKKK